MSAPAASAERKEGRRIQEFLRFCVVGGVGFAVDAGILLASVHLFGTDPIEGRLLSFALAVWATFEMNRRWAFRDRGSRGWLAAFMRYLGVQGIGFVCNFGIYTLLYLKLPAPYGSPFPCLVVASGIALLVNYAGTSLLVFRARCDPESAL